MLLVNRNGIISRTDDDSSGVPDDSSDSDEDLWTIDYSQMLAINHQNAKVYYSANQFKNLVCDLYKEHIRTNGVNNFGIYWQRLKDVIQSTENLDDPTLEMELLVKNILKDCHLLKRQDDDAEPDTAKKDISRIVRAWLHPSPFARVLNAVKKNGLALENASDILKDNLTIVLAAVRNNGLALKYASEELKSNFGVVIEAIKNIPAYDYELFDPLSTFFDPDQDYFSQSVFINSEEFLIPLLEWLIEQGGDEEKNGKIIALILSEARNGLPLDLLERALTKWKPPGFEGLEAPWLDLQFHLGQTDFEDDIYLVVRLLQQRFKHRYFGFDGLDIPNEILESQDFITRYLHWIPLYIDLEKFDKQENREGIVKHIRELVTNELKDSIDFLAEFVRILGEKFYREHIFGTGTFTEDVEQKYEEEKNRRSKYFSKRFKSQTYSWQERSAIESGRYQLGGEGRQRDLEEFEKEFGSSSKRQRRSDSSDEY